ncbi:MAG: ROK family protein, partial [Planctomycetes bacterium]|nr:ROK family protein [Planctomycetota bacterium]
SCGGYCGRGPGGGSAYMGMLPWGSVRGGGIVCRGELVHGFGDNAAELGHVILVPDGRACNCGQRGCFEAYSSANQTALRAEEELDKGRESALQEIRRQKGKLSSKDVFDQAIAGDELALKVVDGTAKYIAVASINMNHITEPKKVVLAGGMIQAGEILLNKVRQFYDDLMWRADLEPMEICYARLGGDAGMIGAAGLALHGYQHNRLAPVGS